MLIKSNESIFLRQITTIINLLITKRNDNSIYNIQYAFQDSNIPYNNNYICIKYYKDTLVIFYFANNYLMSKIIKSDNKIENNDFSFSNIFDVYKILKK